MAPDTKVPDGRTKGRTEGRTDGQRQNNIPQPITGDNKIKINNRHIMFKLKKVSLNLVYLKELNKSVTIYVKAIQHKCMDESY